MYRSSLFDVVETTSGEAQAFAVQTRQSAAQAFVM
jgi:hypothetical protein